MMVRRATVKARLAAGGMVPGLRWDDGKEGMVGW